jgi:mannitol-1-phosphate 5-dehydrogenase
VARGFIGHLLDCSNLDITFVDADEGLVAELARRSTYSVHVLGDPSKDVVIGPVKACGADDHARLTEAVRTCDVMFVSVGGANLGRVAGAVAPGLVQRLAKRGSPLNVIVCENWRAAGETLRSEILAAVPKSQREVVAARLGVAESTIMRSCIEPTDDQRAHDPLAVQVQDFWSLPVDASALIGELPPIVGLEPTDDFSHALERKLYTYNMGNAVISYVGWLLDCRVLSEAARDEQILPWTERAFAETSEALCRRFGFDPLDQKNYAGAALRKLQTVAIHDPLERQVRDPIRKLSRYDHLVGAAMLAQQEGVEPIAVAFGIAAALRHVNANDPQAVRLRQLVADRGELDALAEIGDVPVGSPLSQLVQAQLASIDQLQR